MIGDVPKICDFGLASEYGGGNMITMSTIGVGNLMQYVLNFDLKQYCTIFILFFSNSLL